MDQIHSTEENMRTALQQGLQASTASTIATRAEEASTDVVKKQGIWYVILTCSLDHTCIAEHSCAFIVVCLEVCNKQQQTSLMAGFSPAFC